MTKNDRISTLPFHGYTVTVTRKSIRNLHLRIKPPNGEIFLSAPHAMSDSALVEFLEQKASWIDRHRTECIRTEPSLPLCDGAGLPLFGKRITLRAFEGMGSSYSFDGSTLACHFGASKSLRRQIDRFYTDRLTEAVEPMLTHWSKRMGVSLVELRWRAMTSRWGSCHPRKKIVTLNLRLAFYALPCLEYVLVHELAHFYHPNHSPAFYAVLSSHLPDWRERKRLLESSARQNVLPDPFAR